MPPLGGQSDPRGRGGGRDGRCRVCFFPIDFHPNEIAHRIAAREVLSLLDSARLLNYPSPLMRIRRRVGDGIVVSGGRMAPAGVSCVGVSRVDVVISKW